MIGSTDGDGPMLTKEEIQAMNRKEKATVAGVLQELEGVKQQLANCHEQLRTLIGLYGTLRNEFDTFQAQRVRELNLKVNHGPTETRV